MQIRKGALAERMGKVKLITNLVIVKKNMSILNYCKEKAIEIENIITDLVNEHSSNQIVEVMKGLKNSLSEFTGSKRNKRSLLPFIGNLLNNLFGVATEADVEKEKERLDKIEKWATEYGHVINQIVDETNVHASALNNLSLTLNIVEQKLEEDLDKITRELYLNEIVMNAINILEDLK